jgi:hypothetical protein
MTKTPDPFVVFASATSASMSEAEIRATTWPVMTGWVALFCVPRAVPVLAQFACRWEDSGGIPVAIRPIAAERDGYFASSNDTLV